jgi:hypothetical protein
MIGSLYAHCSDIMQELRATENEFPENALGKMLRGSKLDS